MVLHARKYWIIKQWHLFQEIVKKLNRYLNKPMHTEKYQHIFAMLISDKVESERTLLHETNEDLFYGY